jgi:FMN phosphatase YigB (HAD superfamily)
MTELREDAAVSAPRTAFLVDVDDTLLDNDRFRDDLEQHLERVYGAAARDAYWTIQERRFVDLGYRDYLGAVQEWWESDGRNPRFLALSGYLLGYPFADRLYAGALEVLARLRELGPTIVLTDGDAVFQPSKVERAGIGEVSDALLVYVHKEEELEDVERRYPAERYVLVDDKVRILAAVKDLWGDRVTTVFPRQGHYAHDAEQVARYAAPDVTLERIGDLLESPLLADVGRA